MTLKDLLRVNTRPFVVLAGTVSKSFDNDLSLE